MPVIAAELFICIRNVGVMQGFYALAPCQVSLGHKFVSKKIGAGNTACSNVVGVAGFEPAASWTRTMRDTKLRHTPF